MSVRDLPVSGEAPSLKPEYLVQGDLDPNMDFRSFYSTVLGNSGSVNFSDAQ
jgi:hypothetical protein